MLNPVRFRFLLLALAGLSLLAGLWAGAARLGWDLPVFNQELRANHGPLMVVGFLGTLIALERAVALAALWPYGAPIFAGGSALSILLGFPAEFAAALGLGASFLLFGVFVSLHRQSPGAHFIVMVVSAMLWATGNALWLASEPFNVSAPWWVGFLVLMIAGERLQLSRVMQRPFRVFLLFYLGVGLLLIGLAVSLTVFHGGIRIAGSGLFTLAAWLWKYDVAFRTIREQGLPRFMAACLLGGYLWLAAAGALWVLFAPDFVAGPKYDAMLHVIALGFVFSMIFAHAPVIFPSVTGHALPYRSTFYLHFLLLHASLVLRVIGDLFGSISLQQAGGAGNVAAIVLFLLNNLVSTLKAHS